MFYIVLVTEILKWVNWALYVGTWAVPMSNLYVQDWLIIWMLLEIASVELTVKDNTCTREKWALKR